MKFKIRFGLSTFLLTIVLLSSALAWVGHKKSEYDREQLALRELRTLSNKHYPASIHDEAQGVKVVKFAAVY